MNLHSADMNAQSMMWQYIQVNVYLWTVAYNVQRIVFRQKSVIGTKISKCMN